MAFPQVATEAGGNQPTAATTFEMPLPSGITSGDLLLAFAAVSDNNITWPAGWTVFHDGATTGSPPDRVNVAYRVADGSEGATTTLSANPAGNLRTWATRAMRITGAHASTAPEASTGSAASTTTPDPDSLDPAGWGAEDTLWVAVCLMSNGTRTISANPTNYGNATLDATGAAGGPGLATARRELNASSEDPGTFTVSGAAHGTRALTVAVRPAAGGGSPQNVPITNAAVTNTAQPLSFVKPITKTLGVASATSTAQALTFTKPIRKTLTVATVTNTAQPLSVSGPHQVVLTPAVVTATAQALSVTHVHYRTVTAATETDAATSLTLAGLVTRGDCTVSDAAVTLVVLTDAPVTALTLSEAGVTTLTLMDA